MRDAAKEDTLEELRNARGEKLPTTAPVTVVDLEVDNSSSPTEVRPGSFTSHVTPPNVEPSSGLVGKLFGGKKKEKGNEPPKPSEKRPGRATKRGDTADLLSRAWSGIGSLLDTYTNHKPTANCIQWQAPVAGEMLDEVLKGTIVDRKVLQPLAKTSGKFDLAAAVLGPPAIVFAIETNPQMANLLFPMLATAIERSLPQYVPAMKKAQARADAKAKAARELFPDTEFPEGVNPVDIIIREMFAGWVVTIPTTEEEPNAAQEEVSL